jgi:hypothetical protein
MNMQNLEYAGEPPEAAEPAEPEEPLQLPEPKKGHGRDKGAMQ